MSASLKKPQIPPHRRGHIAAEYQSPGPIYRLNNLCGNNMHDITSNHRKNPAYSFGSRAKSTSKSCSPGPCYYPDANLTYRGRSETPCYSLHYRTKEIERFKTPGPGAYSPNSTDKPSAASFSFGNKLNGRKIDNTPAPNKYMLPSVFSKTVQSQIQQAPASVMGARLPEILPSNRKNPGPGTYNLTDMNTYTRKMPVFSMRGNRTDIMCSKSAAKTPGPGAYLQMKQANSSQKSSPQFSFGVKHSPYITQAVFDIE